MSLGQRIRDAIAARSWSQSDLARRIDVDPQTLQRLLDGRTQRSKYLVPMADVLGVEVAWLTTGNPSLAPAWARSPEPIPGIPEKDQALARQVMGQVDIDPAKLAALLAPELRKLLTDSVAAARLTAAEAEARLLLAENDALRQQLIAHGLVPVTLDRAAALRAAAGGDLIEVAPEHDELVRAALAAEHRPASDLPPGYPPTKRRKPAGRQLPRPD